MNEIRYKAHGNSVTCIKISDNNRFIFSAGNDHKLVIFNLPNRAIRSYKFDRPIKYLKKVNMKNCIGIIVLDNLNKGFLYNNGTTDIVEIDVSQELIEESNQFIKDKQKLINDDISALHSTDILKATGMYNGEIVVCKNC